MTPNSRPRSSAIWLFFILIQHLDDELRAAYADCSVVRRDLDRLRTRATDKTGDVTQRAFQYRGCYLSLSRDRVVGVFVDHHRGIMANAKQRFIAHADANAAGVLDYYPISFMNRIPDPGFQRAAITLDSYLPPYGLDHSCFVCEDRSCKAQNGSAANENEDCRAFGLAHAWLPVVLER